MSDSRQSACWVKDTRLLSVPGWFFRIASPKGEGRIPERFEYRGGYDVLI